MSIETLVFFDLETTGLIENKTYPGIVELSMVAVNRVHFLNATPDELPRVQHRLLLCFNPGEKVMAKISMELTKLTDSLLEEQAPFDKNTCEMIKAFINCLPKPVCLIAHNGLEFHYPILKYHMQSNEVQMEFDDDVNCTDSLYAFYDLFGRNQIVTTKTFSELKREIFYDCKEEVIKATKVKPPDSYQLLDVYDRVIKTPIPDCSRSQRQSFIMLKIALVKAEKFADWIDRYHCKLSEVPFAQL